MRNNDWNALQYWQGQEILKAIRAPQIAAAKEVELRQARSLQAARQYELWVHQYRYQSDPEYRQWCDTQVIVRKRAKTGNWFGAISIFIGFIGFIVAANQNPITGGWGILCGVVGLGFAVLGLIKPRPRRVSATCIIGLLVALPVIFLASVNLLYALLAKF